MKVDAMEISASGLRAQRIRMEVVANNLANMETTDSGARSVETDAAGNSYTRYAPYHRRLAVFSSGGDGQDDPRLGVAVPAVVEDTVSAPRKVDMPEHEHAVKNPNAPDYGSVYFPNVNPLIETVDMMAATRAYDANVTAIEALKAMGEASLRILA